MSYIVEIIIGIFGWFIPERDQRFRRIQILGYWLFGSIILIALLLFAIDQFMLRGS